MLFFFRLPFGILPVSPIPPVSMASPVSVVYVALELVHTCNALYIRHFPGSHPLAHDLVDMLLHASLQACTVPMIVRIARSPNRSRLEHLMAKVFIARLALELIVFTALAGDLFYPRRAMATHTTAEVSPIPASTDCSIERSMRVRAAGLHSPFHSRRPHLQCAGVRGAVHRPRPRSLGATLPCVPRRLHRTGKRLPADQVPGLFCSSARPELRYASRILDVMTTATIHQRNAVAASWRSTALALHALVRVCSSPCLEGSVLYLGVGP